MMNRRVSLFSILIVIFLLSCRTNPPADETAAVYFNLGNAYWELGKSSAAMDAYKRAYNLDSDLFKAGYNLSRIYLDLGKLSEAVSLLEELLRQDPENSILIETPAYAHYLSGNTDHSISLYLSILDRIPRHKNALYNASLLYIEEEEWEKADNLLTLLIDVDPQDTKAAILLANKKFESGDYARVTEILTATGEIDDPEGPLLLGRAWINLRKYIEALEVLDALLESHESPEGYYYRGFLFLVGVEDEQSGLEDLSKAVELGFNDRESFTKLIESTTGTITTAVVEFLAEKELFTPEELELP